MNQATDQAWVEGPGTLTELAARTTGSATGAKPSTGPKTADAVSSRTTARLQLMRKAPREIKAGRKASPRVTAADPTRRLEAQHPRWPSLERESHCPPFVSAKPWNSMASRSIPKVTRRGVLTSTASSTAQLEDSLLHAEEAMIAYTDRPVPFAQLGALNKPKPKNRRNEPTIKPTAASGLTKGPSSPSIECYRNAIGNQPESRSQSPGSVAATKNRGEGAAGLRSAHR